jgi:hypothetical protein
MAGAVVLTLALNCVACVPLTFALDGTEQVAPVATPVQLSVACR